MALLTPMLRINNLYKRYSGAEQAAVDGLNASFLKGQIVGLLGPNGAGKTTTLSIVCGLIGDYTGEISILGLDRRTHMHELLQRISLVPQQIALYPNLSCRENLCYIGRMYRIPEKLLQERINALLEQFDLAHHADKQIRYYSGGMKRRANIMAGLLHEPELLILDEPTAGVDVQSRSMILDFLRAYRDQGRSVIYTSHLLDEAEAICEDILIIDHGKPIIQGAPQDLVAAHGARNLEALFLHLTGHHVRD